MRRAEEKAQAKAKAEAKKAKKKQKTKGKPGRPKGKKNRDKTKVTLTPELTRIQVMVNKLLAHIGHVLREHIRRFGEYVIDLETIPPPLQPDKPFLTPIKIEMG